jgi:hypothetical protein
MTNLISPPAIHLANQFSSFANWSKGHEREENNVTINANRDEEFSSHNLNNSLGNGLVNSKVIPKLNHVLETLKSGSLKEKIINLTDSDSFIKESPHFANRVLFTTDQIHKNR